MRKIISKLQAGSFVDYRLVHYNFGKSVSMFQAAGVTLYYHTGCLVVWYTRNFPGLNHLTIYSNDQNISLQSTGCRDQK